MPTPSRLPGAAACLLAASLAALSWTPAARAAATPPPRQMESLGRGLIALKSEETKIVMSWGLLGIEPPDLAFNLYRSANGAAPIKLNPAPLAGPTHFTDTTFDPKVANTYSVRALLDGREQPSPASADSTLARTLANIPAAAPALRRALPQKTRRRLRRHPRDQRRHRSPSRLGATAMVSPRFRDHSARAFHACSLEVNFPGPDDCYCSSRRRDSA